MNMLLLASSLTEIRPGLIIYTLITFGLLLIVLRKTAWGPILEMAQKREKQITDAVESAKKEREEAQKLLEEQKEAAAQARKEAAESMRKHQAEVEKFREELMAKSRAEADALKADAQRAIQEERAKAVTEVRGMAADLAVEVAKKIIGQELDAEKNKALAESFIKELPKSQSPLGRA